MSKVKIKSNPYTKENEILIEDGSEWKPVIKSSNLNNNKLQTGFFAFVIQDILDILIKEKRDIDCIVFEGTEDDYRILYEIIQNNYENISLIKENTYLNNAENVLKDLKQIYDESYNVILDSVGNEKGKIEKEISKFVDASNDVIPLCVIGNYSSGKSTFINALVGMDILPSGSKPLTQNICKILKSKFKINSYIRFEFNGVHQEITYSDDRYEITSKDANNAILNEIIEEIDKLEQHSIVTHLNKSLDIINKYNDAINEVEIEVPFNNGILQDINKQLLIFDTPGSDTATFAKHKEVLKNELKELTNGMLIFVVEKLDNDANEELFQMINEIEEIDKRFTLIVFNKADNEELPERGEFSEEEIEEIKGLSVPRNLYSNGIYYVSSIIGLGSKIENQFVSKFNKEIYFKKKDEFSNQSLEYYKELYKYDIMSSYLKKDIVKKSTLENNKPYINSGLFAVEYTISKFASNYALYNKCRQSKMFFEKIILMTQDEIEKNKAISEKEKNDMSKLLNDETKQLMKDVRQKADELLNSFREAYLQHMDQQENQVKSNSSYDVNLLKEYENKFRKEYENKFGLEYEKTNANNRIIEIDKKIFDDYNSFSRGDIGDKLKKGTDIIAHNVNKLVISVDNFCKTSKLEKQIQSETYESLFNQLKNDFDKNSKSYKLEISNISKAYFEKGIKGIKRVLLEFINGNPNLNEQQKSSLSGIVVNYKDIQIELALDKIFIKADLKKGSIIAIFSDELDVNKMSAKYHKAMCEYINEAFEKIKNNDFTSLQSWFNSLINEVESQILSLSPKLSERANKINEIEKRISKLINNKCVLENNYEKISDLISWKS